MIAYATLKIAWNRSLVVNASVTPWLKKMKILDFTDICPYRNVALDEALLEYCENGGGDEILRFWEPQNDNIVLGASRKIHQEVKIPSCKIDCIPITRRISGGGTVLLGQGCLNYSLLLRIADNGPTRDIHSTNEYVLSRHRFALQSLIGPEVFSQGTSDLTWHDRKFSGNAQRRKKHYVLFHGTFLLTFDIERVANYLAIPQDQPLYRAHRNHAEFLVNLDLPASALKERLIHAWKGSGILDSESIFEWDLERRIQERYANEEWIFRF